MAIDRWDPFREMLTLRDAMDRLFEQSLVRPGRFAGLAGGGSFPIDVAEEEDRYVVRASLPGVKPEDVHITAQGNALTIRAESRTEDERTGQNWILRERQSGVFQRTLTLPAMVDTNRAEAHFEHGELVLTLPKAEEARPRRIQVSAPRQLGEAATGGAARAVGQGEPATNPSQRTAGSSPSSTGTPPTE